MQAGGRNWRVRHREGVDATFYLETGEPRVRAPQVMKGQAHA